MKKVLFFTVTLFLILGIALPVAFAQMELPHSFYGTVKIGGSDAPIGTDVVAKISNVQVGSIKTVYPGKYGSDVNGNFSPFVPKLIVDRGSVSGSTIKFYINGVDTGITATFISGEVTQLNLSVGSAPSTPTPTKTLTPTPTAHTNTHTDTD